MLSFFVLLFSMSTIQESDWQNLVDSLSTKLDRVPQVSVALPQSDKSAEAVQRAPGTDLDYLAAVLQAQMQANADPAPVRIARDTHRWVTAVPGDLLVAPGSPHPGAPAATTVVRPPAAHP